MKKLPKLSKSVQIFLAFIIVTIALLYPFFYLISFEDVSAKNSTTKRYRFASESAQIRANQKRSMQNRIRQMLLNIQESGNKLNEEMAKKWRRYIE